MLRAGGATVDITPPDGVRMDGYGARREPSHGFWRRLHAGITVLDDGDTCLILVTTDLLGVHATWVDWLRSLINEKLGVPGENVLVSATHNHAGPAGLRGGMFSTFDDSLAERLVRQLFRGVLPAYRSRSNASLKVGQAQLGSISMNRRDPAGPIDPGLRVILIESEYQRPIACVINFACHATVLNAANLAIHDEFTGVACRFVQANTGTGSPTLYLQGACANVNPVWIKQDFDNADRVGHIVGGHALGLVNELLSLGSARAHNIRWDEFPEKPVAGRIVEPRLRAARREVEVPLRGFETDEAYVSRIGELTAKAESLTQGTAERRAVMAQLTRYQNERWAARWARLQPEVASQRTEVQALSLGEGLAVLALPGEFFVETADVIRERVSQGWGPEPQTVIEDLLVACYANDYIGYVIPPAAYEEGGYEAGITFCTPEAEGMFVEAAVGVLQEVSARGAGG
jgi:hypothetical protein